MTVVTTGQRPGAPLSPADAPLDDLAPGTGPLVDPHAQAVLGEMAAMLRDSRPGALFCGAAIAAITIGTAVEAAALPLVFRAPDREWSSSGACSRSWPCACCGR